MYEYISIKYVNLRFIITSALTFAPYLCTVYTTDTCSLFLPNTSLLYFPLLCLSAVYCLPLLPTSSVFCTTLTTALSLSYLPLLPSSSVHRLPLLYPSPTSLCSLPHLYTPYHCCIPLLPPSAPYLICISASSLCCTNLQYLCSLPLLVHTLK
jgi:hypothetical protein